MIKITREIILIALFLTGGMLIGRLTGFPSSLSSMILLLLSLLTGLLKEEHFRGGISDLILKNLAFFFLPPAVRVIESLDLLSAVWPRLLLVMLISNILVMAVTGMVVQLFLKVEHDEEAAHD